MKTHYIYVDKNIYGCPKINVAFIKLLGKSTCFSSTLGFCLTPKVLIEALGYVCSELMKCDDCVFHTLDDESTLSPAVPLSHDYLITPGIFVISSKSLAIIIRQ